MLKPLCFMSLPGTSAFRLSDALGYFFGERRILTQERVAEVVIEIRPFLQLLAVSIEQNA